MHSLLIQLSRDQAQYVSVQGNDIQGRQLMRVLVVDDELGSGGVQAGPRPARV